MCLQLQAGGRCGLHARFGEDAKPVGCRRFPWGLVSTPRGGRITTEHRCPCRTLGDRPALDAAEAERSLCDRAGRLEVDLRAPAHMRLSDRRAVPFERYAALEAELLDRLLRGERAEEVLDAEPLPALRQGSWRGVVAEFLALLDETAGGIAVATFGDALLELLGDPSPARRDRPWAPAFERAIARSKAPEDPERLLNDWLADELWMLRWLEWECAFDGARAELATRLAAARRIAQRFCDEGLRPDQATAEAILIAALAGATEGWAETVEAFRTRFGPHGHPTGAL